MTLEIRYDFGTEKTCIKRRRTTWNPLPSTLRSGRGMGCLPECVSATAAVPQIAADLLHRASQRSLAKTGCALQRLISADRCKAVRSDNPPKPLCRSTAHTAGIRCTLRTMSSARRSRFSEASGVRKAAWGDSVTLSMRASG